MSFENCFENLIIYKKNVCTKVNNDVVFSWQNDRKTKKMSIGICGSFKSFLEQVLSYR